MPDQPKAIPRFFATHHPFDTLSAERRAAAVAQTERVTIAAGAAIYRIGEPVAGLYAIAEGTVEISSEAGDVISRLSTGECFGERGLLLDGAAPYTAAAREATTLYLLPAKLFLELMRSEAGFARFFGRDPIAEARAVDKDKAQTPDLGTLRIGDFMSPEPISIAPSATVADAAQIMRERGISCLLVAEDGHLRGILTTGDLCSRVLAERRDPDTSVAQVMTSDPIALAPEDLGLEAVIAMVERRIGHLPIVSEGRPVGILTRSDLVTRQALSTPMLLSEIARRDRIDDLAATVAKVPDFLAQLVGAGAEHHVVTRLVTNVTDALTRRLIALAEAQLGAPPVPYLWAVCGSQGRQEQTGVSDQDNCLILDDTVAPHDMPYFAALAKFVSDGLDACGFFYCPGDMMATNPRWCQPVAKWRSYFAGWIATPDPEARMLASVMFDLRPVAGEFALFEGLQTETLAKARKNSIFIAHMVANSLTHQPPLSLFRGFALIRSGEHKNALDLKHNGVVPIVDLARLYALMGGVPVANTRARLLAAREAGTLSETGARDLLDAYDLIAETRLKHQAVQIRAGKKPDNFMIPATLSELERHHLKNAFLVVKTLQSAVAQGRQAVS
ncbi:MAG: DUF294 nucleotidyltransferase-like domain-containing protein [Pikeienuella sp.]